MSSSPWHKVEGSFHVGSSCSQAGFRSEPIATRNSGSKAKWEGLNRYSVTWDISTMVYRCNWYRVSERNLFSPVVYLIRRDFSRC